VEFYEKDAEIAEYKARKKKAEYEEAEWAQKVENIGRGISEEREGEISTLNENSQRTTDRYYNRLRDEPAPSTKKDKSEIEIENFKLMGVSKIGKKGQRLAHLNYEGRTFEVGDGSVIFGKVTVKINADSVSLCKSESCQELYL
jgi:hypothetical protein